MGETTALAIAVLFFVSLGVSILLIGGAVVAGAFRALTPRAADLAVKTLVAGVAVAFVISLIAIGLQLVVPGE